MDARDEQGTADGNGEPYAAAVAATAVTAIVVGFVGLMVVFIPVVGVVIGGVLSLIGLAAGIIARRTVDPADTVNRSLATAGVVTSAVVLVFVALLGAGVLAFTPIRPEDFVERVDALGNRIGG